MTALGLLPGPNGPKTLLIGPGMVSIQISNIHRDHRALGLLLIGDDHQSVIPFKYVFLEKA